MSTAEPRSGWRTSSYSNSANNNCVEVRLGATAAEVRDTKARAAGTVRCPRGQWTTFVRTVRSV